MEEKSGTEGTMSPHEVSISHEAEPTSTTSPLDSVPTPTPPTTATATPTTTALTPLKLNSGNLSSLESSPDHAIIKVRRNTKPGHTY